MTELIDIYSIEGAMLSMTIGLLIGITAVIILRIKMRNDK